MVGALAAVQGVLSVIESNLRKVMRHTRLVPSDLPVIAMLVANRSMTGSLLADRLGRQRQNVQVTLARLQRDELVDSWKDDDGRVGGWSVSDKGFEKWMWVQKELARIETQAFGSVEKAKEMLQYLDWLRDQVERATNISLRDRPLRELKDEISEFVDLDSKTAVEEPVVEPDAEWDRIMKY